MISTNSINFLVKMNGRKLIVSYICMLQVIFRHITGTLAADFSINQNITGFVGNTDTHLTCSFFLEKWERIFSVLIIAKNRTEDFNDRNPIVRFKPEKASKLLTPGKYLFGRVTLTNITKTSTNATLTFNVLKCTDEQDYICLFYYFNVHDVIYTRKSEVTKLLVQESYFVVTYSPLGKSLSASSSRPDGISSFIVSSIISETQVRSSSNILRGSNKTSTRTDQNSNISFSTLTGQRLAPQRLKSPIYIREGDILMFSCTGNIGKPPGKLIWQTISLQQNRSITYDNITTYVEEIPGRCSFKGTSNLTVQISAEDLKARIRCFEKSQANVPEMYVETEPLDVHFQTRLVNVNKQPNQKQYDRKTEQINLTCSAIGKPKPEYIWFKQDNKKNILSRTNTYVIGDVNRNNSGIYICEAFNIINNTIYRNSYAVPIDIVDKLLQTESETMFFVVHAAYAVSFTCTVIVLILCFAIRKSYCNREKRNIHSDDQENISEDNDYAEIDRISYHEGNLHSDRIETSNQPITEEEIVLENTPISTYSTKNKSTTSFSYLYVNTDIFNTNENRTKVPTNHGTTSDHPNGLGNDQIGVDNTFDSENSESDTLHVNQYVNTTSLRVPNVYEDLNHMTVDTHKYENPHMEENTTCTE